jgi:hypothetical protein
LTASDGRVDGRLAAVTRVVIRVDPAGVAARLQRAPHAEDDAVGDQSADRLSHVVIDNSIAVVIQAIADLGGRSTAAA